MRRTRNRDLLITCLLLILLPASLLFGQEEPINHPELDWYTIRTEHFEVHFHEGAERTARTVAKVAEEIYGPITTLYRYRPNGLIHFIVKDYDDNSNGAAFYYDNKVEIWSPQMTFILRGTHDWLRNVVTHEFSHMISLGAARKMPRKIPALYLQMFSYEPEKREDVLYGYPNIIASYPIAMTAVPMWIAEGMAQMQIPGLQYDLWDSHRDMLIRTAITAGKALTYDEMGVFGKTSLGNERTYNSGYALIRYIVRQHGREALRKLSEGLSSPLSFTANGALKEVTGLDGESLYQQWQAQMQRYYAQRLAVIDSHRVAIEILT
ncbi:MAG TPA: biopolymer transporter Tol, partial [bacterium]|nr:biopolymer transporter Tol [bacterium]